ncbi:MAG: arsenite methyltransferase [Caldilineaceae bacterium]|nr:arsenite methyltransferase [Caldilineaceae bacterium]MDE0339714.1 arsenite methyltransferase [Caldilineaceae bacterium]
MPVQTKATQESNEMQLQDCCGTVGESSAVALEDHQAIRDEVQTYYGNVAEMQLNGSASQGCCGSEYYEIEDLSQLPDGAVNSSRGCGNPNAIASLRRGEKVLDLGSGGGLDVLLAARQVGVDGFVYGVDMNDKMLELAGRNAERAGATNVEFRKGDLEELPLPPNTVDVVISNCVINLTADKGKVLNEAFRVLKPGGRIAISDIVVDGDLSGLPVSEAQIRAGLNWAGCIAGALTISEFTALLQAAGFGEIAITIEQRYTPSDFTRDQPSALSELQPGQLQELLHRFTSSSIQARKP